MTAPLRVAIVHYHLRPGGVTRVIGHAARILRATGARVVVLAGDAPPGAAESAEFRRVPELSYGRETPRATGAEAADHLRAAARDALGAVPDVWHVHNSTLGKTPRLPEAVRRLAAAGHRMLLQIHDFPEDGRPADYRRLLQALTGGDPARLGECLYPQAPQIHYAALNRRDVGYLAAAGVPADRLHPLPNAVDVPTASDASGASPDGGERLFLYPTRAIRRKNLGEFLLWAAVAEDGEQFATTFAPENPAARPYYDAWVKLAEDLRLPVRFAIGESAPEAFFDLVRSAQALVTTSVAEGFGMAFLEPWRMCREVLGRNLPEITGEFAEAGVDLSRLYDRLEIPLDWVGVNTLRERMGRAMRAAYAAYGRSASAADLEAALNSAQGARGVDFGRLDEPLQAAVIRRLVAAPRSRAGIVPARLCPPGDSASRVATNDRAIRRAYGLEQYGRTLHAIYRRLLSAVPGPIEGLQAERLLDQFLSPERFTLLRT